MATYYCERATEDAIGSGRALLRYIQPNDVGLTGSHQAGYYLPKPVRELYTDLLPERGEVHKHPVEVHWWQTGETTRSNITWYGRGTRSEYRLTGFGHGFPFLQPECIGDLLVLVPHDREHFNAYVLDLEDDIQHIQSGLGLDVIRSWGAYLDGEAVSGGSSTHCIRKHSKEFVETLDDRFPSPSVFSETAREILSRCIGAVDRLGADRALTRCLEIEYDLFKLSERRICEKDILRRFNDVEDFVTTALSVINRRKARAGLSLENHVSHLLNHAGIPHGVRPREIRGRSDIVIPGVAQYEDGSYPVNRLCVVGVKTTCKDRWRQVLHEAPRVQKKHILTTQLGISVNQMDEMHDAGVTLIVPEPLHGKYPKGSRIKMLDVEEFIVSMHTMLSR